MDFKEIIQNYANDADQATMQELTECLSSHFERFKTAHKPKYRRLMRKIFGILNSRHYDEYFATEEVASMTYTNRQGQKSQGAHWTLEQATEAMKTVELPSDVCKYDWWVALSATYADLCVVLDDDAIIAVASRYWFFDEDWPTDTKIWDYMTLVNDERID